MIEDYDCTHRRFVDVKKLLFYSSRLELHGKMVASEAEKM